MFGKISLTKNFKNYGFAEFKISLAYVLAMSNCSSRDPNVPLQVRGMSLRGCEGIAMLHVNM